MTTTDLLSKEEYHEEVNRQAQHLVRAVEESDREGASLPHSMEAPDVLDAHKWFDGSNHMTHHVMIIEYASYSNITKYDVSIDPDNIEYILRKLAFNQFKEDVIKKAISISNH